MRRESLHPLVVLAVDAFARTFGVEAADLWAWMARERPAPRWFVDRVVESFLPGLRETDFDVDESLSSVPKGTKVGVPMEAQPLIGGGTGRPMIEHPFTRALHQRGMTVTDWAASHKVDRHTVKFWYVEGGRQIPRHWADLIQRELKVPATTKTWKNGIREPK